MLDKHKDSEESYEDEENEEKNNEEDEENEEKNNEEDEENNENEDSENRENKIKEEKIKTFSGNINELTNFFSSALVYKNIDFDSLVTDYREGKLDYTQNPEEYTALRQYILNLVNSRQSSDYFHDTSVSLLGKLEVSDAENELQEIKEKPTEFNIPNSNDGFKVRVYQLIREHYIQTIKNALLIELLNNFLLDSYEIHQESEIQKRIERKKAVEKGI